MTCSCGHPLADHNRPGTRYEHYKDAMKQDGHVGTRMVVSNNRFCLQPLCTCTEFSPQKGV